MNKDTPLLEVRGLTRQFPLGKNAPVEAVSDVSFTVGRGEIFGLAGESGAGKSTVARCLLGLYRPTAGEILFHGRCMQMIFQDSAGAMNPRMSIGQIVAEPLALHRVGTRAERREKVLSLLALVGLDAGFADRYPSALSGGQLQRVGIARALALDPDLVVADEPVASLDVSVQAQMANLFQALRRERGTAFVLIAHDLAMVRHLCDRVGVMRAGRLLETGTAAQIFQSPAAPYTRELLSCILVPDPDFMRPSGK